MKHSVTANQISSLSFERVWVREAVFVDGRDQSPVPPQALQNLGLTLGVSITFDEGSNQAAVSLSVTVEPPKGPAHFERLSGTVEGLFSVPEGSDRERLSTFATLQAPVLLLPYVRQVITALTAQSRLGALVIPPLNMVQITSEMKGRLEQQIEAR